MTKQEYIEGIRHIAFGDLGEHIKTDIDDEANKLLEDGCDCEVYDEARSKGNIIRFDKLFMVWLNGVVWAWNELNDEELTNDEIVPNFEQVFDNCRLIGRNGNAVFFGEYPRL